MSADSEAGQFTLLSKQYTSQTPSAPRHPEIFYMLEGLRWCNVFPHRTPTRDTTSELLDALRQREVAVFGPSTPGQTRTPNEGNGTPKRNIFFGNLCICIPDEHRGSWSSDESRIVEQQKQQHSSSSTAAAAQQQQHSSSYLLYTSPSPRDATLSRMPSSA